MTESEHPAADATAAAICSALDAPAIAAGFAAGQASSWSGAASVIFCADPAALSPSLREQIDDETHGPDGPRCLDLTVEAEQGADGGWQLTRADFEAEPIADAPRTLDEGLEFIARWLEAAARP